MLIGHVANGGATCQKGKVHGGESEQSVQNIGVGRADADEPARSVSPNSHSFPPLSHCGDLRRDLPCPEREIVGAQFLHLVADRRNVVDQPQFLVGEEIGRRRGVNAQARERKHASAAPLFNGSLNFRRPQEVGLVRGPSPVLGHGNVIVRTTDLVLGAVAAKAGLLVS